MDSLRDAVAELNQWRSDHGNIIRSLGLAKGLSGAEGSAGKKSGGSDSIDRGYSRDGEAAPMDIDNNKPEGDRGTSAKGSASTGVSGGDGGGATSKITLHNLSACIHAAEKIAIGRSLKEVREMRSVLQNVNEWIEQCQSLCPRRQSKRRVQPSNKPTFERLQDLIADGLAFRVAVVDEVDRIRRHIAEALSWQLNAKSVLERVTSSFAEQTIERREIWRKEDEESRPKETATSANNSPVAPKSGASVTGGDSADIKSPVKSGTQPTPVQPKEKEGTEKPGDGGKNEDPDDDGSDANDREDELDEAEESNDKALLQTLTTARDISVFMPEEMVAERVQRIVEWAR